MRDLAEKALNAAEVAGATYADIRIVRSRRESLAIKNGRVEEISAGESFGFGIRVLTDGAWGFAASYRVEPAEIEAQAKLAVKIAKASAMAKIHNVRLAPEEAIVTTYRSPREIDPFEVSIEDKMALLTGAEETLRKEPKVQIAEASMNFLEKDQVFASSEGSFIEQNIVESGAGISATAIENGEVQVRSYPNSARGNYASRGYEFVKGMKLAENAGQTAAEAAALLTAKDCPSKTTTLILHPTQMVLQIHESVGHPIELDRVLGMEESLAGTSFLTTDKLNELKLGSELVNITADATLEGALGSFGYDDEGVEAKRVDIVKDGVFVGYLTSRETAPSIQTVSNGTMRASSWNQIPLIRMTNINLLPGESSLEEMIADTKEGLMLSTNRSWSIDNRRLNFQFATEIGWEIKDGKLGDMVKNPNYTGITPEFWSSCDAVGNADEWQTWGVPNCGKGEPMQSAHVGHGTAAARFQNVQVGVGRE